MEEKTAKAIFLFQELFLLEKTVFAFLSFCSILNHSDKILLVTLPLQQRQSARWFENFDGALVFYQWQQHQNVYFLVQQSISPSKRFSFFCSSDYFTYQLNLFLFWQFEPWIFCQLSFFPDFLAISSLSYGCCECW